MKKYKLNIILLFIVTIFVLYFSLKDDFNSIIDIIFNVNILWIIMAIILIALSWFFSSLSLYTLSKDLEKGFKLKDFFKSIVIANFFCFITPYAVGGQPFQVYYLNKRGMKLTNATNIIVEFFRLHQIALVIFGFIAVFLNYQYNFFPHSDLLKKLVIFGFIINILVIMLLTVISFGKKTSGNFIKKMINLLHRLRIIKNKEAAYDKIDSYISNSRMSTMHFREHKDLLVQATIYHFISLAFLYVIPLVIAYSIGDFISLNPITAIVSSAYVMLIGALIPVPGGSGGLEYGFAQFFGAFITGSVLMAILLLWRTVTYYLCIIVGGIILVFIREKEGKNKCE